MIDRAEFRIPYVVDFKSEFRFIQKELRYAGMYGTVRQSKHYQGTCDMRPFGIDAILHLYFKGRGERSHKIEVLDASDKSVEEIGRVAVAPFDVEPYGLKPMRLDFAADLFGVPVALLFECLRVKGKRSADERGELDYEVVGGRRLEYFRYGKAPNCTRVYDKPAECLARLPSILKKVSPDAEIPTYEDIFGFPPSTVLTRVERQAGGGRIPREIGTFRDLYRIADLDPFESIEIIPQAFCSPDPRVHGDSRSLKLWGTRSLIEKHGYQLARTMLNTNGNAKRFMDDYSDYLRECSPILSLTREAITKAFQETARAQALGHIKRHPQLERVCTPQKHASA